VSEIVAIGSADIAPWEQPGSRSMKGLISSLFFDNSVGESWKERDRKEDLMVCFVIK